MMRLAFTALLALAAALPASARELPDAGTPAAAAASAILRGPPDADTIAAYAQARDLARRNHRDPHVPIDDGCALALDREAAERGMALSAYEIGHRYRDGDGVPRDPDAARQWFLAAAAGGEGFSMMTLAKMANDGEGGPVDPAGADRWYREFADHARPQKVSNGGEVWVVYRQGGPGSPVAPLAGRLKHLMDRADAGDNQARFDLADLLETGSLPVVDKAQALKWYRQAAVAGNALALYELGRRYAVAEGLPRDLVMAGALCTMSVSRGLSDRQPTCDGVTRHLDPGQQAEVRNLVADWKPGQALPLVSGTWASATPK